MEKLSLPCLLKFVGINHASIHAVLAKKKGRKQQIKFCFTRRFKMSIKKPPQRDGFSK